MNRSLIKYLFMLLMFLILKPSFAQSQASDVIITKKGEHISCSITRQDSARYATGLPAALVRGGSWGDHHRAGVFAVIADGAPSYFGKEVGFRCAK